MSWYQDPQMFICNAYNTASHGFNVYRCKKDPNGPVHVSDLQRISSGIQQGSDFDALLAYLINFFIRSGSTTWRIVNCQGLAIIWEQTTSNGVICSWSREPLDSPYYHLPGISPPVDLHGITPPVDNEKEALKRMNSELKARNSTLEADVQREKNEKRDLEKQVSELKSKLKKSGGGSAGEQPWKTGKSTVPDNWVSFEELDVLNIQRNTSLKMIKASAALKSVEDKTTNVHSSHFYRGVYLEAVNVEELIPNKHEARFDPAIWHLYKNGGTFYAARKLF